jgi:hypothetical protein
VNPDWHARTWDRWWDVHTVKGYRQLLTEQHPTIRKAGLAALDFYARDPREGLRERAVLGYKGRLPDERILTDRMVRAVAAHAAQHRDLRYRDALFFAKDHDGAGLEETFTAFFELGNERFSVSTDAGPGTNMGFGSKPLGMGRMSCGGGRR